MTPDDFAFRIATQLVLGELLADKARRNATLDDANRWLDQTEHRLRDLVTNAGEWPLTASGFTDGDIAKTRELACEHIFNATLAARRSL